MASDHARDQEAYRRRQLEADEAAHRTMESAKAQVWRQRHPDKRKAHEAVGHALRDGRLQRPDHCSACGVVGKVEAHHDDYTEPLAVRWLCRSCHRKVVH